MEYPEFGIYEYLEIEEVKFNSGKQKKGKVHSGPISSEKSKKLIKKTSFPNGILKQIYQDLDTVSRFIKDTGELMDRRVFL